MEILARRGDALTRGDVLADLGFDVDMEEAVETLASSGGEEGEHAGGG